ncbi:AI-2E family transporter [Paraburkholderia kirstenboschensis]|uniref:AI-2E family transporter n=1 Tax=Paraburkholderia kirstenboschensis TaxID=1245436 RepID=UPI000FFB2C50|nr:AI-2E family transporter [Paraburkholderia kirstenboschensis]
MQLSTMILTPYQRYTLVGSVIAAGLGVLLWTLRPVLTPFLLGALIAYMLQPGVEWLVRQRVPRAVAVLLMMLLFALLLTLLPLLVLAVMHKEGPELAKTIPVFIANLNAWLQPKLALLGISYSLDLAEVRRLLTGDTFGGGQTVILAALRYVRTGSNVVLPLVSNVILVPLVLFYQLYDRHQIFARMESFVPLRWVGKIRGLVTRMDHMLSQYLRGQLLVMGVLAVFYPIALTLAGLDIALPIGLFTGLAVFIPYVGFAVGLALALLAALLQFGGWYGIGAVAAVYGVGQVLESSFLVPKLVGDRIGLHPLAVIFALLAFGQLFGFFGVLLALPVSAILAALLGDLRRRYVASALYKD